jgi:tetratricopeptide (TPR) repeat protein
VPGPLKRDLFVSYTSPDVVWAEWIAWHLESDGYSTTIQAWDFRPGHNFAVAMQDASESAERTIAVISPAFFASPYTNAEWAAAFTDDPDGREAKFVPVRVRECEPPGLHKGIIYIDLVGLGESDAQKKLLDGVRPGRGKPGKPPTFPGGSAAVPPVTPGYPGEAPPIWNIPIAARTFEGRDDVLAKLTDELAVDGRATVTQTQAVHGLGGVGKTQLVSRFAHQRRDEYDVVWWVRAEQEATRFADYAALAAKLELPDAADASQAEQVAATKSWLERSARWLLIFDNAPDPEAIAALLPDGQAGHVLITSRRHANWRSLGAAPLQLDVWERRESVDFLLRSTGSEEGDAADQIAALLGDLPLALSQAAAYANEQAITLKGFQSRLLTRSGSLLDKGKPIDYGATVATTWDLAFEQISGDQTTGGLLGVCAHLAPERIPRELLAIYVDPTEPSKTSSESADKMIQTLLSYALLTAGDEETLDMHRLVQQVARERLDPESGLALISAAIDVLYNAFPAKPRDPEHWLECGRLLPHALAAAEYARTYEIASPDFLRLMLRCASFLGARADHEQASDVVLRTLRLAEHAYGPSHPFVAPALVSLGILQYELGKLDMARETQERALAIGEATYGPDSPAIAGTLGNLGIVLHRLEELDAAREMQERALAIEEAADGPDSLEVAKTLANLGGILHQLGELSAARKGQERALAIEEAAYGRDHTEVARSLGNLGIILDGIGEFAAAREVQERALMIEEAAYGPDHPELAKTLGNLGLILYELGEIAAARAATKRALTIFTATYGPEHPDARQAARQLESFADLPR